MSLGREQRHEQPRQGDAECVQSRESVSTTCDAKIGRMWVNGVEVTASATFRVTMNNFLATGGSVPSLKTVKPSLIP
jgi:hypothetical protein